MIFLMHGVAANLQPGRRFVHRNLLDWYEFEYAMRHRKERGENFVPLREAMADSIKEALTVDDSTVAAANAARLARKHGQPVTLFVNGQNIVERLPYWFTRINASLDAAPERRVAYGKTTFDLRRVQDKARLRGLVKREAVHAPSEGRRQAILVELESLLGVHDIVLPRYLEIITIEELRELAAIGVDVQNHGWTHTHAAVLSPGEHADSIARGRAFVREHSGCDGEFYAPPYGNAPSGKPPHCEACFLAKSGTHRPEEGLYDRTPLVLPPSNIRWPCIATAAHLTLEERSERTRMVNLAIELGAKRGAEVAWPEEAIVQQMPADLVAKHSRYLSHALAMPAELFDEMRDAINELPPEADPGLDQ
jgi:peptidoglycan/xylan/chitin deacetylase (PgdA/CDA1 family)